MNINKTELKDLKNIELLWNNGQVMKYVGYPEGINTNQTKLNEWFSSIESSNDRAHYSIYQDDYYLGELFYNAEKEDHIIIDIKLMPSAWGKGIATYALSFLLDTIFDLYPQGVCFVDPHEDNVSAKRLYKALGFKDNRLSWQSFKPSKRYLNDTITLKRMVQSDMERLWELSSKDAYYEYAQYNAPYFNEFRQRTYPEFIEESSSFYLSNPRVQGIYYRGRL
ncbi:MAG: GNAT family N-acetyltransferase, partial [Erysipelothrix sp.]|nr:GNAT family N-acetyltransferase [Erysipelothrix sp.]